jgi:hypothetical protein
VSNWEYQTIKETMSKPKVTVKTVKALYNALQKDYELFRQKVRAYVLASNNNSNRRPLMTIDPVTSKGQINAITITELIMLVKLSDGTGEQVLLEVTNQDDVDKLYVVAKKKPLRTPLELL